VASDDHTDDPEGTAQRFCSRGHVAVGDAFTDVRRRPALHPRVTLGLDPFHDEVVVLAQLRQQLDVSGRAVPEPEVNTHDHGPGV
jgi:hypothetical protein